MAVELFIVDDHHLMVEGYKSILQYNSLGIEINISAAYNCEAAFQMLFKQKVSFDLIMLDLNLPPFPLMKIHSGEDLALLIAKQNPDCKIIILTSHAEGFLLYNIIKKINPSGLLVKSDFTAEDFLTAFDVVMNGGIYYSPTVKQSIREISSKDGYLDNFNRQIISLLSQGIKTKNLPEYLPLSISAIDKRKAQIKDYLGIQSGNDEDIIREARRLNYI